MTRAQADAIAQAILQPGQHAQQQRRLRRERQAAWLLRRRRVAAITVAGCGLGAAAAWLSAIGFSQGVLYGGLTGAALGWLLDARRNA